MLAPIVISGIRGRFDVPILLNVAIDVMLLVCIIPGVVDFITEIPNSNSWWCRRNTYPAPPVLDAKCLHWKLIVTILMGISAGFTLLIWYVVNSAHRLRIFGRPRVES